MALIGKRMVLVFCLDIKYMDLQLGGFGVYTI